MMTPEQSYIICTSPRSGGTLLCTLLTDTGLAGAPESLFYLPEVEDWARRLGVPSEGRDARAGVRHATHVKVWRLVVAAHDSQRGMQARKAADRQARLEAQ